MPEEGLPLPASETVRQNPAFQHTVTGGPGTPERQERPSSAFAQRAKSVRIQILYGCWTAVHVVLSVHAYLHPASCPDQPARNDDGLLAYPHQTNVLMHIFYIITS